MTKRHWSEMVAWTILTIFAANSYLLIEKNLWFLLPAALALASAHLLPGQMDFRWLYAILRKK